MLAAPPRWSLKVAFSNLAAAGCTLLALGCGDAGVEQSKAQRAPAASVQTAGPTAEAAAEIAEGNRLFEAGQYEQAIEQFTRALQKTRSETQTATVDERLAEVFYRRGAAFLRLGFPDTAVEDFSDAINLNPQHADAYEQRGRAFVELKDSYKAVRDCTTAIRLKPNNTGAYHARGLVYLNRGQFDRSVADLEYVAAKDAALAKEVTPKLGEAFYRWSEQLTEAGDQAAAADKFAKARELNPTFVDSQIAATAPPAAVEQTVAKPIIDDAIANFQKGRELQLEGRYDQALIEYAEAIALRRDYDEAYLRRGETLLALGFPDTALEDLKRAAHRGAESAEAFRLEAKAFAALDNPHRTALSATDALHLDPTHAETYALRGEAYTKLENWDRAVADLDEAIRRDPSLKDRLQPTLVEAKRRQAQARNQTSGLQAVK
jgi:tetratricopeptide (TPR) repeat protein